MIKPPFVNGHLYHIYNRGVEKRTVFTNKGDFLRFIHDLYEFNDIETVTPSNVRFSLAQPAQLTPNLLEVQPLNNKTKKPLLEILAFCLMPNHYHLLVKQLVENGIVKFMQKLGTGYTVYFNLKNQRVGSLFQGRFKAVLVNKENHLIHLPYYIHLNPLDLVEPQWREGKFKNYNKAIEFLESYRWSSFRDYTGRNNFPSVTSREFLLEFFGGPSEYKKSTFEWLAKIELGQIKDILLED